jgi:hypothetical protein
VANYVKSTNFAVKDGLPSGDPLKVVKGTEIDTEFNNIATAVASKADITSPTFLGTPFAPTASPGTNTNQLATTAFVMAARTATLEAVYPVGSIYTNATNATNPGTLLGFGTWTAFGAGRVPVGFDSGDSNFNVAEKTGGSKDAIVVSHTHTGSTSSSGSHTHDIWGDIQNGLNGAGRLPTCSQVGLEAYVQTEPAGAHTHTVTVDSTGSSGTNANLQPYITVYMWKRTA